MLIDTHCHLSFPDYEKDLEEVVLRIQSANFYAIIESTVNLENSYQAFKKLSRFTFVYFSLGFHPYYVSSFKNSVIEQYREFLNTNKRIVSLGEVGLDIKSNIDKEEQIKVLRKFCSLAEEYGLCLVIHNRGFKESLLSLLEDFKLKRVVLHCFSQDRLFLDEVIRRGYFVSFAPNITFKNAHLLKEVVKVAPLDKILVETDSPYLAPQKIRGKRNEPLYVKEVIEEIASLKKIEPSKIEDRILQNARSVWGV